MPNYNMLSPGIIVDAAKRIAAYTHRTPVLTCQSINRITGSSIFFKAENLQKAGAFKSRGAVNAVFGLSESDAKQGVCTHSSGNHAQALARAAAVRGIPSYIVMPENAPRVKVDAVKEYGGIITFCKPNLKAREYTLEQVRQETGAQLVHPYDDFRIIAGQATAAKELFESIPDLDLLVCPVGGGGLLSGTALSTHYFSPSTQVIAAEPEGADDAARSFRLGSIIPSTDPDTIADGLLTSLGERNFPIIKNHVSEILTTPDKTIIEAMRMLWLRAKILVEPSAAVGLAIIMLNPEIFKGKRTGVILSGGNLDPDSIPWLT